MQFESLQDFLNMNGHGFYVWSAYAIVLATIVINILVVRQQKKRELKKIRTSKSDKI